MTDRPLARTSTVNKVDLVGANGPARKHRVAILGTGLVGATTAYALLLSGLRRKLPSSTATRSVYVPVSTTSEMPSSFRIHRRSSSEIFPIAATAISLQNRRSSGGRPQSIRNLVDRLEPRRCAYLCGMEMVRFPHRARIGSGTSLDTSRLRRRLAEHCGVAPDNVHAYVVGVHGDSQVALLSSATIAGVPLAEFSRRRDGPVSEAALAEMAKSARTGGLDIQRAKGATNYGICGGPRSDHPRDSA
jgi:hypothetical protein